MLLQQTPYESKFLFVFVILDMLIGLAFLAIPIIFTYVLNKRKDTTPFRNVVVSFIALFLISSVYFLGRTFFNEVILVTVLLGITVLAILSVVYLLKFLQEAITIGDPRSLEDIIFKKTNELAGKNSLLLAANEEKQKAEEEVSFLFNFQKAVQLSSIVSVADKKGTIIYVNENFEKISGYTKDELLGQNHRIINSGYHEKSFWVEMWKTIAKGGIWREEVKNKAKNGSFYWVDTFIIPFVNENGEILQYLSIRNDISRRKKAELQLKQLNEELEHKINEKTKDLQNINEELAKINFLMESLQKHVHIGVWETDLETWKQYWSDEIFDIYELSGNKPISFEETINYFHHDYREQVKKAIATSIQEGVSWDLETKFITAKNNEIWVRTTGLPIVEEGKVVRIKGLFQNIDRQKKIEEQLRSSQSIVNLAIDAGEIGVFKWDIEKDYWSWNNCMAAHFGWPKNKLRGNTQEFLDKIHPEDFSHVENEIKNDFSRKTKFNIHYRVVLDTGHIHFLETIGLISRNSDGKAIEMIGICLNITEKKETEILLREKEEQFRLALEYSATGMTLQGLDGKWLKVNKAFLNIIGYEEEELLKIHFHEITHPDDIEADLIHQEKLIDNELESYELEKRYFHKNGSIVWIQINKSLVRNSEGDPLYFISQVQDITRRKFADQEIKKMNALLEAHTEKLEMANKELESFTYSVSHDLRAPLRSINGYAQILKEDYEKVLDKEGNEVIDVVIRNAQRMGQLIDDLLEFSRIGKKEVAKGIVDMPHLVESIANEMVDQEKGRKIEMKILPLEKVKADLQMVRQVWINLISNAIKYTRYRDIACIEIGSNKSNGEVLYYIKDNGVGFNMDYVEKLFEVFQRLHRNDEFEGTGVGLALVRRIINRHGGKIWVEAKENQGATFYFTIPKNQ